MEDVLNDSVEFIPVKQGKNILYLGNIIKIVDANDYEKATLRKLETGLVVGFEKYTVSIEKVQNLTMFKTLLNDKIYSTEIYITESVKK